MKINQTRNYTQFVHDGTNRPITDRDSGKLKLLRESMKKYGFLPFPLLVKRSGDKLRILDGQHRFAVAQELGLQVLWVETERDDIIIAETAAAQSPWALFHYVASYAAQGRKDYLMLQQFVERTGLPLQKAASLLSGESANSSNVNNKIKEDKFAVRDTDYAWRVSAILEVLKQHVPWAFHNLSVAAISRFARVKEFDDAQMVKKIATHPHMLKRCPTLDMFSDMFEEVYNHMSRARIPLAFLAREVMSSRAQLGEQKKLKAAAARLA